jgi:heterodisulfide reductase subunit B2
MENIGYYPGCSSEGTAKEYDKSLKMVLSELDVSIKEIEDWSCCGASSAHATNHYLANALPARNLALSTQQGLKDIFAPCAACYNRLVTAQHQIKENKDFRIESEKLFETNISSETNVLNVLQMLKKIGIDKISAKKKTDLKNIKAACYYGCLLLRPNSITGFDDPEDPSSFEEILNSAGVKTIDWNFKTECCGGSHFMAHTDIVVDLSKKILDNAKMNGANVIVTACPVCHANLDMRQIEMKKRDSNHIDIPVLYISELIGLAFGFKPEELGINLHFTSLEKMLNKIEEVAV